MGRKARVVIAGTPHHVMQRGNRRQPTFFEEADDQAYLQQGPPFVAESGSG